MTAIECTQCGGEVRSEKSRIGVGRLLLCVFGLVAGLAVIFASPGLLGGLLGGIIILAALYIVFERGSAQCARCGAGAA